MILARFGGCGWFSFPCGVMPCGVMYTVYNWRSSCTLGLMADKALREAYEAMGVDLWIALLSFLSS